MSDDIYRRMRSKLEGVNASDILFFADYDLTLANKPDPKDFDYTPLDKSHYCGLLQLASVIRQGYVVTARGEKSALGYLRDHEPTFGPLTNFALLSNSGFWYRENLADATKSVQLKIPGYDKPNAPSVDEVLDGMDRVIGSLVSEFGQDYVHPDKRELCRTVVYNFEGTKESVRYKDFVAAANELVSKQGDRLAPYIMQNGKARVDQTNQGPWTNGYIDFKPKGMDKGVAIESFLNRLLNRNSFVIAAGDSSADYPMLEKVAAMVPEHRRLCVCVGQDLVNHEQKLARNGKKSVIDVVAPNVDAFHDMLAHVYKPVCLKQDVGRAIEGVLSIPSREQLSGLAATAVSENTYHR